MLQWFTPASDVAKREGKYSDEVDGCTCFLFHRERCINKGSSSQQLMQPTLSDPINDTTAAVAAGRKRRRRALAPIRNDISERGRERERNITTAMIKVKWD